MTYSAAGLGATWSPRRATEELCARPIRFLSVAADTRAILNGHPNAHRYLLAVGSAAQRLASETRVEVVCRRAQVTLAEADTATAEEIVRGGGPWIYVFRSKESANRALALFGG